MGEREKNERRNGDFDPREGVMGICNSRGKVFKKCSIMDTKMINTRKRKFERVL